MSRRLASLGECMIELRHSDDRTLTLGFGGDTLNTAVYAARVGAPAGLEVSYITALGDDSYSDRMIAAWREEGVGTELVARLPGRLPGLYIIRTDARGERFFTYFRSAAAARDMLRPERVAAIEPALAGFDMIYLSGVTLSILDRPQRETLLRLLAGARRNGARVAFDGNYRPAGWPEGDEARAAMSAVLRIADIALPTLDDEIRLFGDDSAESCAQRLQGWGVREVAVKLGAEGCFLSVDGSGERVAADAVAHIVDTTAAGDAFNAGYLAARLLGREPAAAARLGNRLAAAVIQHPGAIVPKAAMPDLALGRDSAAAS